jgi:hypothetical protein
MCVDEGAASCGTNGLCNGAGNCQRYPEGTLCAETCDGPSFTRKTCDVAGMCSTSESTDCSPNMCTVSGCQPA